MGRGREWEIISKVSPWVLTHEEQSQKALADRSHRQTETQTAQSDSIVSGKFGSQSPYIFSQEKGTDFGIFATETGTDQDGDL